MLRYQKYSWQVAPLQSPLPLLSGRSKVMQYPGKNANNQQNISTNMQPKNVQKWQRKKEPKKERRNGMGYRPLVFMLGF
jgi:hypothetical protein